MNARDYKTRSEQRVEQLEGLRRPLTDAESDELRRALHAVYVSNGRSNVLAQQRNEELKLLEKLRIEARKPSPLS